MLDRLFVYGTLRKDVRNSKFQMLEQEAGEVTFSGTARIRGWLFQLGNYPGLVLSDDPGEWVRGEVYVLTRPGETLSRLDDYEGCGPNDTQPYEYERVAAEIVLDSGSRERAWVYVYKGSIAGRREIASGDYGMEEPGS